MTTLQEYLNKKYPTKEEREKVDYINLFTASEELKKQGTTEKLEARELDLSEYMGAKEVLISDGNITKLTLGSMPNLEWIQFHNNNLISLDFLNALSRPEKLKKLIIYNNNIQPTDIAFFSKFINLYILKIGATEKGLWLGKRNKFYGSFESWKDLNLISICIEATDVDRGLEYLPMSLAESTRGGIEPHISSFECLPHIPEAKCQVIQNELRPFNYDLEAWQLAHPEKMLIARPELFTNPDSKDKWLEALNNKITQSKETLTYIAKNEADKTAKIVRLETQIKILEETKNQLQEEIENEREIHSDSMKAMDNFYQQNPPQENIRLKNILQEFEKKYLKLNQENQAKEQEVKELKENIKISNKILEQEYNPKQTKEQGTQTDLTGQDYEQQRKENEELREQLNKLIVKNK